MSRYLLLFNLCLTPELLETSPSVILYDIIVPNYSMNIPEMCVEAVSGIGYCLYSY